jgi:hypothetical protein
VEREVYTSFVWCRLSRILSTGSQTKTGVRFGTPSASL